MLYTDNSIFNFDKYTCSNYSSIQRDYSALQGQIEFR